MQRRRAGRQTSIHRGRIGLPAPGRKDLDRGAEGRGVLGAVDAAILVEHGRLAAAALTAREDPWSDCGQHIDAGGLNPVHFDLYCRLRLAGQREGRYYVDLAGGHKSQRGGLTVEKDSRRTELSCHVPVGVELRAQRLLFSERPEWKREAAS